MEPILSVVFALTFGGAWAACVLAARRDRVPARLRTLGQTQAARTPPAAATAEPPASTPAARGERPQYRRLQHWLLGAGIRLRAHEYVEITVVLMLALGGIGAVQSRSVAGAVAGAFAALLGSIMVVRHRRAVRARGFESQLAEALMLIAGSLRSGYAFARALHAVAEEMPDPIAEEFHRVLAETRLGASTDHALTGLLQRMPGYDLEMIVSAVHIQRHTGGNLAEILTTIAATMRERERHRREIAALTAESKVSMAVCLAAPPVTAVLLQLGNPTYLQPLFTDPGGRLALLGAAVLQVIGIHWIRAVARLDL